MTKNDLLNIAVLPVIGALASAAGALLLQQIWVTGFIAAGLALVASYIFWLVLPE
jgi:hypothetical protein